MQENDANDEYDANDANEEALTEHTILSSGYRKSKEIAEKCKKKMLMMNMMLTMLTKKH